MAKRDEFVEQNVEGGTRLGTTDFFDPEGRTQAKPKVRNPLGKSMKKPADNTPRKSPLGRSMKEDAE